MAGHDAEKRVTDLERQLADQKRGGDLPPSQPTNAAPETGNRSREPTSIWFRGSWANVFLVIVALVVLNYGIYDSYGYWVGTPTTATLNRCEQPGESQSGYELKCTGTWRVGGRSQSGPIEPPFFQDGPSNGASLAVHVNDGTAFTPSSLGKPFYVAIIGGPIVLLVGSIGLWRAQRKRKRL